MFTQLASQLSALVINSQNPKPYTQPETTPIELKSEKFPTRDNIFELKSPAVVASAKFLILKDVYGFAPLSPEPTVFKKHPESIKDAKKDIKKFVGSMRSQGLSDKTICIRALRQLGTDPDQYDTVTPYWHGTYIIEGAGID
jgi:hypothetical protein